jgi:hypothetical protein
MKAEGLHEDQSFGRRTVFPWGCQPNSVVLGVEGFSQRYTEDELGISLA